MVKRSLECVCAAIPDGKVVGMFAFGSTGLGRRTSTKNHFDTLDDVIMNVLGGKLISSVTKSDSYSLLTLKGKHYGGGIAQWLERRTRD